MNRPKRVLSLAPNVSMILFALGVDDMLVGRTSHCLSSIRHYLDVWQITGKDVERRLCHWDALPEVGTWPDADPAQVMALEADVILTSGTGALDVHSAGRFNLDAGALFNFDTRTLADLDRQVMTIGQIVGRSKEAGEIVEQLARRRAAMLATERLPTRAPTVLFEYCVCIKYHPDPAQRFANPGRFVMVGGYLAPELVRLAGGQPLFAQQGDSIAWTDFRAIRDAEPDIVLAFDCGGCPNAMKHPVAARPGWPDLAAVAGGSVFRPGRNIANPNLCYIEALGELMEFMAVWETTRQNAVESSIEGGDGPGK